MGIVWTSIFWLTGIFFGQQFAFRLHQWLLLLTITAIAALVLHTHKKHRNLFLLLMTFSLAGLRVSISVKNLDPTDLAFYNDLEIQSRITGTVIDDPDQRESHTRLRVRAERLVIPALEVSKPIDGDLLVHASKYQDWSYGDWVRIKGELRTPPQIDNFSYRDHLARKGIYTWMPQARVIKLEQGRGAAPLRWLYGLRRHLYNTIGTIFPEPEASLVAGILLGIESDIPHHIYEEFNRTGTTHIIAISGFNITLIANLIIVFSRRIFGARRGLWAAALGIGFYTLIVGADAAVVRAAVMAGLALLARYSGRQTLGLASLGASSILMTVISPQILWDVGFQLSFAATLGLILYAPPLHTWSVETLAAIVPKHKAKQFGALIAEFMLYTVAAQITTWPLTAYHFQRFSLIAFLTNPLILPLQPLLMSLCGAATIVGAFSTALGNFLALFAWPFPALTIRIVSLMSRFANSGFGLSGSNLGLVTSYYSALFGATILIDRIRSFPWLRTFLQPLQENIQARMLYILVITSLITAFIWQSAGHSSDGLLHILFLDVGPGDAVLITSPTGERILVDGGGSSSTLLNHLGNELPLLNRKLSAVIIAGTQTNQTAGLLGLSNHIRVGSVLIPPVHGSYSYRQLKQELLDAELDIHRVKAGQRLSLGNGASVEVVECTDTGMVLLIAYRNARVIIPAGIAPETIDDLMRTPRFRDISALLLADGGHPSVNPTEWLETTNPRVVILSIGTEANSERPSQQVLSILESRPILRTDQHGSIEINTDGSTLWASVERPGQD